MLETGITGKQEVLAEESNSAKTMGSGTLDVFATPAMIALMEKTAWMFWEISLSRDLLRN